MMDNITSAEILSDFIAEKERLNLSDVAVEAFCKARYETMCKISPIGEHKCSVRITFSALSGRKPISCDTCLQKELTHLIKIKGIETIGSCCGHGKMQGYIQVVERDVTKMIDLGYEQLPDDGECGKWCFKPKTTLYAEELV